MYLITPFVCIKSFRNDDIQNFVLMICNFFEIDDMHTFGVIFEDIRRITATVRRTVNDTKFLHDFILLSFCDSCYYMLVYDKGVRL